jgi:hypothetical protein
MRSEEKKKPIETNIIEYIISSAGTTPVKNANVRITPTIWMRTICVCYSAPSNVVLSARSHIGILGSVSAPFNYLTLLIGSFEP